MKITDYERVNSVQDSDVLLIDGNRGTKTIHVNDFHRGHTILDEEGTTYPQRSKLQFEGCEITDDADNGVTVVKCEGGGIVIVEVPTVTNTELIYDGTAKSPTITRDTAHTTITGTTEATELGSYSFTISLSNLSYMWNDNTIAPKTYTWGVGYDGSTITPVNDIQTWLKCAMITDKSYTTLSEVLNDHETLYLLLGNENATDYLVRSTSWASDITADQTAMNYIGRWNYCANTLLGDSTWAEAIVNSEYFESILNTKIPTMTSNTTPSGEASQSTSLNENYAAYKAVSGGGGTSVLLSSDANGWWQYKFDNPTICNKFTVQEYDSPNGMHVQSFWSSAKIKGSNDGTNFVDIAVVNGTISQGVIYTKVFANNTPYLYYRLQPTQWGTMASSSYRQIGKKLQFYGRSDVTENQIDIYSAASDTVYYLDNGSPVTVCTTDTTGHAIVDRTTLPNGTYTLYSSVAKDPNNLSNDYSKSVTVSDGTAEIKVMPDGKVLYWFGYGADNIVIPPNTSGNSSDYFNSLGTTVTKNTNNVTGVNTSSPTRCAVGCYVEMDVTDISNVYVYGADLSIASSANYFFSVYLCPLTAKKSDNTIAYDENEIYQHGTQKTLDGNEHKELFTMDVSTYTGNKYVIGGGASYGTGRTKISNRVYAIWGA